MCVNLVYQKLLDHSTKINNIKGNNMTTFKKYSADQLLNEDIKKEMIMPK